MTTLKMVTSTFDIRGTSSATSRTRAVGPPMKTVGEPSLTLAPHSVWSSLREATPMLMKTVSAPSASRICGESFLQLTVSIGISGEARAAPMALLSMNTSDEPLVIMPVTVRVSGTSASAIDSPRLAPT